MISVPMSCVCVTLAQLTIDNALHTAACSAEIGSIEQSVYQLYQAVTEYYPAFE